MFLALALHLFHLLKPCQNMDVWKTALPQIIFIFGGFIFLWESGVIFAKLEDTL